MAAAAGNLRRADQRVGGPNRQERAGVAAADAIRLGARKRADLVRC